MRQVKLERKALRGGHVVAAASDTPPEKSGGRRASKRGLSPGRGSTKSGNEEKLLGSILSELKDINKDVHLIKKVAEKH